MTVTSGLLLAGLAAATALGMAIARGLRALRSQAQAQNAAQAALRARMAERGRVLAARERLEEALRAAEDVVDVGTRSVRAGHQVIAEIPFSVLDQIPATKDGAQVARKVHDATAKGVYDAISFVNKLTGEGLRRGIHRDEKPPDDSA